MRGGGSGTTRPKDRHCAYCDRLYHLTLAGPQDHCTRACERLGTAWGRATPYPQPERTQEP